MPNLNQKSSLTEKARLGAAIEELLDHLEEYKLWWRRNGNFILEKAAEGDPFTKRYLHQILARKSSFAAIFRRLS